MSYRLQRAVLHFFTPDEIAAIADRIDERADKGRIVHLLPKTAMLAAYGLRLTEVFPPRTDVVKAVCPWGRDCARNADCYSCTGRANAVMALFDPLDLNGRLRRRRSEQAE